MYLVALSWFWTCYDEDVINDDEHYSYTAVFIDSYTSVLEIQYSIGRSISKLQHTLAQSTTWLETAELRVLLAAQAIGEL